MDIAAQISEVLAGVGVTRVYGIPGEDHMRLLDALAIAGIEYVTAFNESSAVLMATTEAQVTGVPGVVVLSLAPGVSNGLNGLLNAYVEEVPLLVFSGQHAGDRLPFTVRQGFDIEHLVAPMTKWRARVTAGMDVSAVLGRALDIALSGRPGPVYLEVPDEVATAEAKPGHSTVAQVLDIVRPRVVAGPTRAPTGRATIDHLAARIAAATHPVLVLGGRRSRVDAKTVVQFAEAWRVPVFTASRQKGIVDSASPFFAGTFLNGRLERELTDHADLVLMVDAESFDFYNRPWCFSADAISLVDADFADWSNPVAERHVVDPQAVLAGLLASAAESGSAWTAQQVADYRAGLRTTLLDDGGTFSVARAVEAALSAWPREGYLAADAGFSKPLVAMLSDPALPDHYLASNALSTMGYSIPAAVALRKAGGGSPVLAFLGDGSLLMRATEMMVDTGVGAPLVYVAIMDGSLTQIQVKQERRRLGSVGSDLPRFSCAELAGALGFEGVDVQDADTLRAAVARGLAGDRPLLVGAHVDPAPSRPLFEALRG